MDPYTKVRQGLFWQNVVMFIFFRCVYGAKMQLLQQHFCQKGSTECCLFDKNAVVIVSFLYYLRTLKRSHSQCSTMRRQDVQISRWKHDGWWYKYRSNLGKHSQRVSSLRQIIDFDINVKVDAVCLSRLVHQQIELTQMYVYCVRACLHTRTHTHTHTHTQADRQRF